MDYKKFQGMLRTLVGNQPVNVVARQIGVPPAMLLYFLTQGPVDQIPEGFLKALCMLTPGKVSLVELADAAGWTLTTGCMQAKAYGNDFPARAMFNANMWRACAMDPRVAKVAWNSIEELATFFIYVGTTEEITRYEISKVHSYNGRYHQPAPYFFYIKLYYDIGDDHFCQTMFVYFMHDNHDKIILMDMGFLVGDIKDAGFKLVGGPGLQPHFPAVQVVNAEGKVNLRKDEQPAKQAEDKTEDIPEPKAEEKSVQTYVTTLEGCGFEIYDDPTPDEAVKLLQFLQQHKDAVVALTSDEMKMDKLSDFDSLFRDYADESTLCSGIGCIIAAIMTLETGIPFMFFRDDKNQFPDNKSCVMTLIPDWDDEVLESVYSYAAELGISQFGPCYFTIEAEKQEPLDTNSYKKEG